MTLLGSVTDSSYVQNQNKTIVQFAVITVIIFYIFQKYDFTSPEVYTLLKNNNK